MCASRGLVVPAHQVDHITPHAGNWNAFILDPVQSLCDDCHNADKQQIDRLGYSRRIGLDGLPLDKNHPCYGGKR
jgi:5-methylcytosine-specific restriction endonuclease McrA